MECRNNPQCNNLSTPWLSRFCVIHDIFSFSYSIEDTEMKRKSMNNTRWTKPISLWGRIIGCIMRDAHAIRGLQYTKLISVTRQEIHELREVELSVNQFFSTFRKKEYVIWDFWWRNWFRLVGIAYLTNIFLIFVLKILMKQ